MTQPTYTRIDGNNKELTYSVVTLTGSHIIEVAAGFRFNGASIPVIVRTFIGCPFTGNHEIPALFHDALYASESMSRAECDRVFLEMLREHGVGRAKRLSMYLAVRAGGWYVWRRHTPGSVMRNRALVSVRKHYEGERNA